MIMNHVKEEDILKAVANPFAFAGSDAFPYKDESARSGRGTALMMSGATRAMQVPVRLFSLWPVNAMSLL